MPATPPLTPPQKEALAGLLSVTSGEIEREGERFKLSEDFINDLKSLVADEGLEMSLTLNYTTDVNTISNPDRSIAQFSKNIGLKRPLTKRDIRDAYVYIIENSTHPERERLKSDLQSWINRQKDNDLDIGNRFEDDTNTQLFIMNFRQEAERNPQGLMNLRQAAERNPQSLLMGLEQLGQFEAIGSSLENLRISQDNLRLLHAIYSISEEVRDVTNETTPTMTNIAGGRDSEENPLNNNGTREELDRRTIPSEMCDAVTSCCQLFPPFRGGR